MNFKNCLLPNEEQKIKLSEEGPLGPVFMVNLIKFKDYAVYEDGRETELTGQQAYHLYGEAVVPHLSRFKAEVVFSTEVTELMIGVIDQLWDVVNIVKFESRSFLNDFTSSAEWEHANVHRLAGIEGQLNFETVHPTFSGSKT
jgi:uncharacterized protein (DUF1330 family)